MGARAVRALYGPVLVFLRDMHECDLGSTHRACSHGAAVALLCLGLVQARRDVVAAPSGRSPATSR